MTTVPRSGPAISRRTALTIAAAAGISVVGAFGFLAYTLVNLDRLGIGLFHPRVVVEAGLGVAFGVASLILMTR
jgi:hypothetical protein